MRTAVRTEGEDSVHSVAQRTTFAREVGLQLSLGVPVDRDRTAFHADTDVEQRTRPWSAFEGLERLSEETAQLVRGDGSEVLDLVRRHELTVVGRVPAVYDLAASLYAQVTRNERRGGDGGGGGGGGYDRGGSSPDSGGGDYVPEEEPF